MRGSVGASLWVILISWFFISCGSSVSVKTSPIDRTSVRVYRSFNFYDIKVQRPDSGYVKTDRMDLLKSALTRELAKQGVVKAEEPDLWINLAINIVEREQTRTTDIREAPPYIGQRNYHWEAEEIVIDRYREGTLTMDVVDAKANKMIGQSVSTGVISGSEQKIRQRIDEVAMKMVHSLWTGE